VSIKEEVKQVPKPFDIALAMDQIEMGCSTDALQPKCAFADRDKIGRECACQSPKGWSPIWGTLKCLNRETKI